MATYLRDEKIISILRENIIHKLYRIIKFLIEKKKLGLKRTSDILFEKGYRSVRTKSVLRSNYIHSIYKKGKIREERICRSFKSEITNVIVLVNES